MSESVPLTIKISGHEADDHVIPAYDGLNSMAGFALTASIVSHYLQTGEIRRRREFLGRTMSKLTTLKSGSIEVDFLIQITSLGAFSGIGVLSTISTSQAFYDILARTLTRNISDGTSSANWLTEAEKTHGGDLEALVSATEASTKQAHSIIGYGASTINVFGGTKPISKFDSKSKIYISNTFTDNKIFTKDVTVASFNVNSGTGGVYDSDLKRVVPIHIASDVLTQIKTVMSWGLNQYANGTGKKITLKFNKLVSEDGRPKRYLVIDALKPVEE